MDNSLTPELAEGIRQCVANSKPLEHRETLLSGYRIGSNSVDGDLLLYAGQTLEQPDEMYTHLGYNCLRYCGLPGLDCRDYESRERLIGLGMVLYKRLQQDCDLQFYRNQYRMAKNSNVR